MPFENRTKMCSFQMIFVQNGSHFVQTIWIPDYSGGNCTCIARSLKHVVTGLVVNVHRWLATPTRSRAQTVATLPTATAAATRPTIATPKTDPLSCLTTYKRTMTRRYQTTLSSTISKPTNRHWQHTQLFILLSKLIIWHFYQGTPRWSGILGYK